MKVCLPRKIACGLQYEMMRRAQMTDPLSAVSRNPHAVSSFAGKSGILVLVGCAILNFALLWELRGHMLQGYGDFASFYTAGQIVRSGQSARLYDPRLQWKFQQEFASQVKTRLGPLPYVRPPFEALLFVPFAWLSYPAASVLWLGLNVLLVLTIPVVLPKLELTTNAISTRTANAVLCLSFFPVGLTLIQGQDAIVLLLILVIALRLLLRSAEYRCGAVLALGLFKFHFVIPLFAIFLLWRKRKVAVGFLAVGSILFLISLLMVRWSGLLLYPKYLWALNQVPDLGMTTGPQNMPNIRGILSIWLQDGHTPAAVHWVLAAIVILGIAISGRMWRGDDRRAVSLAFSFAVVATLLTSYYAKTYDLTLLLLPLLLHGRMFWSGSHWKGPALPRWPRVCFLAAAAVLLCAPLLWILALRTNQFSWIALVMFALAASLFAVERYFAGPRAERPTPARISSETRL